MKMKLPPGWRRDDMAASKNFFSFTSAKFRVNMALANDSDGWVVSLVVRKPRRGPIERRLFAEHHILDKQTGIKNWAGAKAVAEKLMWTANNYILMEKI